MRTTKTILAGVAGLAMAASSVMALPANITIYDGTSSSATGWRGMQEDNEVEPASNSGQKWDLEGFFLDGSTLSMVGGYNFKYGVDGYNSGDIFFSVNSVPLYGGDIDSSGGWNYQNTLNSCGYQYALHMDFAAQTFSVYALTPQSIVKSIYFKENRGSNPYKYVSGGTAVQGYQNVGFSYLVNRSDSQILGLTGTALTGGSHNMISLNAGFLGNYQSFYAHYTYGCGNDNLMGTHTVPPTRVPDASATAGLFAGAVAALTLIRRRLAA